MPWHIVIAAVWAAAKQIKSAHPTIEWDTLAGFLGPAAVEAAFRDHGVTFVKLLPTVAEIRDRYHAAGGDGESEVLDDLERQLTVRRRRAARFKNPHINWASAWADTYSVLDELARMLPGKQAAEQFLRGFYEEGRLAGLNDTDRGVLSMLELQFGIGMFAAVAEVRERDTDLTPEYLAAALAKKYGLTDDDGCYSCHWCGFVPCGCGGRQASTRKVTWDDAHARHAECTPATTELTMRCAYGTGRNQEMYGAAGGSLRALIEILAELGVATAIDRAGGTEAGLRAKSAP
ncbi:MAG: hypothetical protein AAB932_01200 [Patescibacteria group bacterium]